MNKIEVQYNTKFSQPYCACHQKEGGGGGFVTHRAGIKKHTQYEERKEKPNVFT